MLSFEKLASTFEERTSLSREVFHQCLRMSSESGESLDRVLMTKGNLTEKQVLEGFAVVLDVPFIQSLSGVNVPSEFVMKVPVQFARYYNLIAVEKKDGVFTIATCSPFDVHPMDELCLLLEGEVSMALAPRAEITALINKAYEQKVDVVDEMLEDLDSTDLEGLAREVEQTQDLLDLAHKAPIIKLVNMILFQALRMRASDVHIQPYEQKLQIRYRIDGTLYDMMTPPKKVQEAIISRVKVMGKMDIAERRLPQDGRATIRVGDSEVDIRISSVPTIHGERIVMRLLDKNVRLYELEELGLSPDNLKIVNSLIRCPHGIILVTGPTGSGKTTTLYAALKRVNSSEKNVITIEDPIEYHIPGISQIEVSTKKGLTFATGLRSIVRQDPDIIMVGEIRDVETAEIAIQSALTGHLVFSTLHTNDSAGTITRLLDLGIEPYLVASSVIGVIAQRLVRLVCKFCKEPYEPVRESVEELGLRMEDIVDGKLWRGRGCSHCLNTGYWDRTGIFEVLPITEEIRELIMKRTSASAIKHHAVQRGLQTLRMDGARKVLQAITTIDEVLAVTQMDVF